MVDLIESIVEKEYCQYCLMFDEKAPCTETEYCDQRDNSRDDIGRAIKKWISSFDSSSATECFTAVNVLKERLENGEWEN